LTPLTQTVEVPELRRLLTDATDGMVQSVLRLGYPLAAVRPTPRRGLDELLLPAG
jgi:hypothetical protein